MSTTPLPPSATPSPSAPMPYGTQPPLPTQAPPPRRARVADPIALSAIVGTGLIGGAITLLIDGLGWADLAQPAVALVVTLGIFSAGIVWQAAIGRRTPGLTIAAVILALLAIPATGAAASDRFNLFGDDTDGFGPFGNHSDGWGDGWGDGDGPFGNAPWHEDTTEESDDADEE